MYSVMSTSYKVVMKKYFNKLLLFMLVLALAMTPFSAQAESKRAKAIKKYQELLEKADTGSKFALIYLNNDAIPELIYMPNEYVCQIFTYKNSNAAELYSHDYSEDVSGGYFFTHYYSKKNVLVADAYTGAADYKSKVYFLKSGGKYKPTLEKSTTPEGIFYNKIDSYKYTGITAAKFKKQLKNKVGSVKATKIKFYKNTKSVRKKYLK